MAEQPWDRQEGETMKAYAAFIAYRDLPDMRRSISNAIASLFGDLPPKARQSKLNVWKGWSSRYNWQARVKAWQEEQARIAALNKQQELESMNTRHAQEAMALQQKALERLKLMSPSELSATNVLRYLIEAARLERTARGEPEEITERRLVSSVEELTDDDLAAIASGGRE